MKFLTCPFSGKSQTVVTNGAALFQITFLSAGGRPRSDGVKKEEESVKDKLFTLRVLRL